MRRCGPPSTTRSKRPFKPEFLNRIDDIVIYHPLTKGQMTAIVDIQVERLRKQLAEKR